MMDEKSIHNKHLRFAFADAAFYFEECAHENLFNINLCPHPGVTAEILRDYVKANNYGLSILRSHAFGTDGGEKENGTTLRLLALNEIDFTGFDLRYCILSKNFFINSFLF